jgi:hypothetical protein
MNAIVLNAHKNSFYEKYFSEHTEREEVPNSSIRANTPPAPTYTRGGAPQPQTSGRSAPVVAAPAPQPAAKPVQASAAQPSPSTIVKLSSPASQPPSAPLTYSKPAAVTAPANTPAAPRVGVAVRPAQPNPPQSQSSSSKASSDSGLVSVLSSHVPFTPAGYTFGNLVSNATGLLVGAGVEGLCSGATATTGTVGCTAVAFGAGEATSQTVSNAISHIGHNDTSGGIMGGSGNEGTAARVSHTVGDDNERAAAHEGSDD